MKQGNVEADDCVKSHVLALPLSLLENISSCWQDSTQQAKALRAMAATLDPRVHKDMNFTTERSALKGPASGEGMPMQLSTELDLPGNRSRCVVTDT